MKLRNIWNVDIDIEIHRKKIEISGDIIRGLCPEMEWKAENNDKSQLYCPNDH